MSSFNCELECRKLQENIIDTFIAKDGPTFSDSIEKLRERQSKLAYQKMSLQRTVEEKHALANQRPCAFDVQLALKDMVIQTIKKLELNTDSEVSVIHSHKHSDFQTSVAFKIGKMYGIPTKEVAEKIIKSMPQQSLIESYDITGAGFINMNLKQSFLEDFMADILINGVQPIGFSKSKVVLDMSSPNIAKEMHVGHLRSTIIGDAIARLYEFLGCDVDRASHIGDWGTQFGMLIAYMNNKCGGLENSPETIRDLQAFYKEAKKVFDQDQDFKKEALEMVVKLQTGDPDVNKTWKMICDVSLKEFHKIYDRLEVDLFEEGESFFQSRMNIVVEDLRKKDLLTLEDGCQMFYLKHMGVPPLFVVKSDGGYTYATSDLATLRYRIEEVKADVVLYVVDNGQSEHFKSVYEACRLAGWYNPAVTRVEHIGFGVVLGDDKKKFKTRSGDTVRLVELLDEGVERALKNLEGKDWPKEEIQRTAEGLAYSCIRYADLSHSRNLDYVFSFDKMLENKGNTACYLIYGATRIKSILRKTKLSPEMIKDYAEKKEKTGERFVFEHPSEIALMKTLSMYPLATRRMLKESSPHLLCDYIYELTGKFMDFYEKCHCTKKDESGKVTINMDRLSLCVAVLKVLFYGFHILGISTKIERM